MGTILVITGIVVGVFLLLFGAHLIKLKWRMFEYKDWEINDLIILKGYNYKQKLIENGKEYAKIRGWTEYDLYIDIGDDITYKVDWEVFDANKSAIWRRNYKECEKAMGKKPSFNYHIKGGSDSSMSSGDKIDGKVIILLTEVECQAYLQKAISREDYDTAEKIKKQMEKYR